MSYKLIIYDLLATSSWLIKTRTSKYSTKIGSENLKRQDSRASLEVKGNSITARAQKHPHQLSGDMQQLEHEAAAPLSSGHEMDLDTPRTPVAAEAPETEEQLIIATDFGTTFSTVAFARRRKDKMEKVEVITDYAGDGKVWIGHPSLQVPTESWYPNESEESEGPSLNNANHDQDEDPYRHRFSDAYAEDSQNDEGGSDENDAMDLDHHQPSSEISSPNFIWGYGIHQLIKPDADLRQYNRITRSKLLLDKSPRTESVREELRPILERLKIKTNRLGKTSFGKTAEDVIADYLTQLFLHTKTQLATKYRVPNGVAIEHVLCVPVVWDAKACRTMQSAMETAIKSSGLGSIEGLFFVSEPEAAAAYIIGNNKEVNVSVFSIERRDID